MTESIISYEMRAGGDVRYDPIRSTSGAFGPCEVHPQRCRVLRDGPDGQTVGLEHDGEWLCLFPDGQALRYLAFGDARGGRATAEKLAAMNNAGRPTRVVELDGRESASAHTAASVQAELDAAAGSAP